METWLNFEVSLTSHSSVIFKVKNNPRLGLEEQTRWTGTATSQTGLSPTSSASTRGLCDFIPRSFLSQLFKAAEKSQVPFLF